jgi:acyl carrier protein
MPGPLSPQGRQKALFILAAAVLVLGLGVFVRAVRVVRDVGSGSPYTRVRAILVRRLGVPPAQVTPDAPLVTLLPDPSQRMELVQALEEELSIDLPPAEAASLRTVQDAVRAVERHTRRR